LGREKEKSTSGNGMSIRKSKTGTGGIRNVETGLLNWGKKGGGTGETSKMESHDVNKVRSRDANT